MKNKIRVLFCMIIVLMGVSIISACDKKTSQDIEITPYGTELEVKHVRDKFLEEMKIVLKDCEREYLNLGTDERVVVNNHYYNRFVGGLYKTYRDDNQLNKRERNILTHTKFLLESTYKMNDEDFSSDGIDYIELYNFYRELLYKHMDYDRGYDEQNPLRIKNASLSTDSRGRLIYEGILKNHSSGIRRDVQVRATYFDANDEVITFKQEYVIMSEGIRPNESKEFTITENVRGDVSYGRLEVVEHR